MKRIWYGLFLYIFTQLGLAQQLPTTQTTEMRAVWVTRWDYQTRQDVEAIIRNALNYNFNSVLFQVRGNGTVAFRSSLEPWMEKFDGRDPGWDPLQVAIESAHKYGLKLHAWVNVYIGWQGTGLPKQQNQLYNRHRDWFVVDPAGNKQKYSDENYHWLSPTHPEVKPYLLELFTELIRNYDLDGVHFDYIRYAGAGYSYDKPSLQQFSKLYRTTPAEMPQKWADWRRQAITDFLQAFYQQARQLKPALIVSAAVVSDYALGRNVFLQDSHHWLAAGVIDAIFPMTYTADNLRFRNLLHDHMVNNHGRMVFPGVRTLGPSSVLGQLQIANEMGARGAALFAYQELFPNHKPNRLADTLRTIWPEPVQPPVMKWKGTIFDSQGPVITDLRTLPAMVNEGEPFKVLCRITDPSGVYPGEKSNRDQGVYLIYNYEPATGAGTRVYLSKLKDAEDWFITEQAIAPQAARTDFTYRIFAYDDYYESAGHPMRNPGYSNVETSLIHKPMSVYKSRGEWGPLIFNPVAIKTDARGRVWVVSSFGRHVRVLRPDGQEESFSPLETALDAAGRSTGLPNLNGIAISPDGTVYLSGSIDRNSLIFRFNLDGKALPAWSPRFTADALDCDRNGNLFALESGTTTWHVFNAKGQELLNSPFGNSHSGVSLSVSPDGGIVYVSNRSVGTVQRWTGAIEAGIARYWPMDDWPMKQIGIGRLSTDKNGNVYVPQSQNGVLSVLDATGKAKEYLSGGKASLRVPSAVGISPDGNVLYVIETAGLSSMRLQKWIKED